MSMYFRWFFLFGLSFTDTGNSQNSRGREGNIFLFSTTTSARPRILRCLFSTLDVKFTSLFNYHLIDDRMLIFVCLNYLILLTPPLYYKRTYLKGSEYVSDILLHDSKFTFKISVLGLTHYTRIHRFLIFNETYYIDIFN